MGFHTVTRILTHISICDIKTGVCQTMSYHLSKTRKGIQSDNNAHPRGKHCTERSHAQGHKRSGRQPHVLDAFISL